MTRVKICNEKESESERECTILTFNEEWKRCFVMEANALQQCTLFSVPCPGRDCLSCVQMGLWQSYSCSPNCPLSVLLIPWFKVHVFQLNLSCEVAGTFLVEWQSCLKPKNVGCHFQLSILLSKEKAWLKELCNSWIGLSIQTLSINQLKQP